MTDSAPLTGIRKGLLELAVLTVIGAQRSYAGEIRSRLEPTEFSAQEGTLYPLLSKMRRDGLLEHEWEESEAGPPRKYYVLTKQGKARQVLLRDYWKTLTDTLGDLETAS
jgi:PadR family transcriptional regulator PadR